LQRRRNTKSKLGIVMLYNMLLGLHFDVFVFVSMFQNLKQGGAIVCMVQVQQND
jgi:hypothetical protein